MSVEAALVQFAAAPLGADAPRDLQRLCLFDWAACGLAGAAEPVAGIMRAQVTTGGPAHLIGGGAAQPAEAALVNGATSHALDYDDTHFAHIGHTSVGIIPAALALAEGRGADMDALLYAALIGAEAAVRVGVWLGRDHYQIGFHQTSTAGAVGAAVASMRLLNCDAGAMMHGLGLISTLASGLKNQFGTMGKPLNAGLAAEAGVRAALWAQAGLTSAPLGLSGPQGLAATHHGMRDLTAFEGLGQDWRITQISHKFHACCHGLHAMIEALSSAKPDVLPERITVATHPRWLSVCNDPAPTTGLGAKFSYPLVAAMVLCGVDTAALSSFSDEVAQRPDLVALRDRVTVIGDDTLTEMQARVTMSVGQGGDQAVFADLDAPLSLSDRETRLRAKAASLLGDDRAGQLWQAVHAEKPDQLARLLALS